MSRITARQGSVDVVTTLPHGCSRPSPPSLTLFTLADGYCGLRGGKDAPVGVWPERAGVPPGVVWGCEILRRQHERKEKTRGQLVQESQGAKRKARQATEAIRGDQRDGHLLRWRFVRFVAPPHLGRSSQKRRRRGESKTIEIDQRVVRLR